MINSTPVEALVDIGADFCVISKKFLRRAMGSQYVNDLQAPAGAPSFVLGNGTVTCAEALVRIQTVIGAFSFTVYAYIFQSSPYDLILGSQFLRSNHVDILCSQRPSGRTHSDYTVDRRTSFPFLGRHPTVENICQTQLLCTSCIRGSNGRSLFE